MEAFAFRVCVVVFTVASLAAVGLGVTPRAALAPLRDARFVVLTLVAGWVLCPAVALALLQLVPIDPAYAAGLLMLSLAPAAPFAPAMMQMARADGAYAAAFMLLASVVTVVVMPAAVPALLPGVTVAATAIARPLVILVLAPLGAGLLVRQLAPARAEWALPFLARIISFTGAALLVLVVFRYGHDMASAVGSYAIATELIFVVSVTLGAHALGSLAGDAEQRVVTLGICSRNLGAALAPLAVVESDPRAIVMVVIAAPITLACSVFAARWLSRRVAAEYA